jgi:hypothetical protein
MAKFLISLASGCRCGRCGHTMGEDTEITHKMLSKFKPDSVYRPVYFCRTENCVQRGVRIEIDPVEVNEYMPAEKT